jgi:hypothetical protein
MATSATLKLDDRTTVKGWFYSLNDSQVILLPAVRGREIKTN